MSPEISRTILFLTSVSLCSGLQMKQTFLNLERNNKMCAQQAKTPYFDIDMVIGKPWRIYYTWNVEMSGKCLDMVVKNATSSIANRIYNDMHDYLATQPAWDAATLHITMGTARHELLLFADQGSEGTFLAVPNVIRDGNITPTRKAVPLLRFFLKLLRDGKFLLMLDCQIGVASLLSRQHPPYRSEVVSVVNTLDLGLGAHACVSETRKDEFTEAESKEVMDSKEKWM